MILNYVTYADLHSLAWCETANKLRLHFLRNRYNEILDDAVFW